MQNSAQAKEKIGATHPLPSLPPRPSDRDRLTFCQFQFVTRGFLQLGSWINCHKKSFVSIQIMQHLFHDGRDWTALPKYLAESRHCTWGLLQKPLPKFIDFEETDTSSTKCYTTVDLISKNFYFQAVFMQLILNCFTLGTYKSWL